VCLQGRERVGRVADLCEQAGGTGVQSRSAAVVRSVGAVVLQLCVQVGGAGVCIVVRVWKKRYSMWVTGIVNFPTFS